LKRRLGGFLLDLRKRAGKTAEEAAAELRQNKTNSVTRYENGQVLPPWGSVFTLLMFYGASDAERERAKELYDDAKHEPRSVILPPGVRDGYRQLVNAEREAVRERELAPSVVPGLLQTQRYAQALVDAAHLFHKPDTRPGNLVDVRVNRKKPLEGPDPLVVHALIDEAVLHREIGGPDVLREQLTHLLQMAERPNVTLQVIPYTVGAYGTMNGSCIIIDYPEPDDPPGVYLEYPAGGNWVDNQDDVKRFTTMFDEVTRLAHTPTDTTNLIGDRLRSLEGREQNGG
jgi:transcriptional regulator with XRE-family HTH domain